MREKVVVLGATSGIARSLCHVLSRRGCQLLLAGRRVEELDRIAADLQVRYQTDPLVEPFDAEDFESHGAFVDRCFDRFGGDVNGLVLCYGYMTDQSATQTNPRECRRTINVNFTSAASVLHLAAIRFESQRTGFIAVVSSVAGDRGRKSNYTYGSSKAGLSAFVAGLRHRLAGSGVHVLTVKPGFVDTPMTQGLLDPRSPLVASPEKVARDIDRAIRQKRQVLYTPWFWRYIMLLIRLIPERIFLRLNL